MDHYLNLFMIALATSTIAMTITKAHITEPIREWVNNKNKTAGYLLRCPYCSGHWIVLGLMLASGMSPIQLTFWIEAGAVLAVSTLIVGLMLRALFTQEAEIDKLYATIEELQQVIRQNDPLPPA